MQPQLRDNEFVEIRYMEMAAYASVLTISSFFQLRVHDRYESGAAEGILGPPHPGHSVCEQPSEGGRIGVRVNGGSRIAGLALILLFGLSVFAVAESGGNRIFVYKQGNSDAIIEQARDGNYSCISQEGNANNAIASISGGSNGTTQTQSGNDNRLCHSSRHRQCNYPNSDRQ